MVIIFIVITALLTVANGVKDLFFNQSPHESEKQLQGRPLSPTMEGEIIVTMTLTQYENALRKQHLEIQQLSLTYTNELQKLNKALAENIHNQQNVEKGYAETIASYKMRIAQLESMRGELPDNAIDEGKQKIANDTRPQNKELEDITTKIVYPLSGFKNTRVRAMLWDDSAQLWFHLGEMEDPSEVIIENVNPNQWYWLVIEKFDKPSNNWKRASAHWLSM